MSKTGLLGRLGLLRLFGIRVKEQAMKKPRVCGEELGKCIKCAVLKIDLVRLFTRKLTFASSFKSVKVLGTALGCVAVCQVNMGSGRSGEGIK